MKAHKGFTLLELLLAVFIFSVGVFYALKSFMVMAEGIDNTRNRVAAMELIEEKISGLKVSILNKQRLEQGLTEENVSLGVRRAVCRRQIELIPERVPDDDLQMVQAGFNLTWNESNRPKEKTFSAFFALIRK